MSKLFDVMRKDKVVNWDELIDPIDLETSVGADQRFTGLITSFDNVPEKPRLEIVAKRVVATPEDSVVFFGGTDSSPAVEQYRVIRTRILHHQKKPQVVAVTSASSGDGKTVTAVNLAGAIAMQSGARVLLVDGGRTSGVLKVLGLEPTVGFSEVVSGRVELQSALVHTEQIPNLFLFSADAGRRRAEELSDARNWRTLLQQAKAIFTTIIVDAPLVSSVAEYEPLQVFCDGVVLVLRPDHSNRLSCARALDGIAKDKFLGVVLNSVQDCWFWKSGPGGEKAQKQRHKDLAG